MPRASVDCIVTTAYFHRPEEIAREFEAAGLEHDATVAVEGPAGMMGSLDAIWDDPARRERLLAILQRLEEEPSLLGASSHLLGVGRKS